MMDGQQKTRQLPNLEGDLEAMKHIITFLTKLYETKTLDAKAVTNLGKSITRLQDIALSLDSYLEHMQSPRYDLLYKIDKDIERVLADDEIGGAYIRIPLRLNKKHYAWINYAE